APATSASRMLELADVHTYYGNIRALRGVSLSVAPGEIVTLIGSNGAGKTTTLRTILGTARPRRGSVTFGGQRLDTLSTDRMARPTLLLLDEPSMGLAPILVETIFRIIQDINRQGTTILLVEQNARMALGVAHRGYVMQTGRIVLQAAAAELLRSDLVRKTYLGEK